MAPETFVKRAIAALAACCVVASASGEAIIETPLRDPWVPPEVAQKARVAPATSGAELHQEVDRKLRARFEAAAGPSGSLTREGAHAAGLGFVERHFEAIDRRHAGRVSYEDYRQYVISRGASLE